MDKSSFHRYHIATKHAALSATPIFRTIVNRADFCINCGICQSACPYGVHERKHQGAGFRDQRSAEIKTSPPLTPIPSPLSPLPWFDLAKMASPKNENCTNCFHCVNECPAGALSLGPNPDYKNQGDDFYKTEMISAVIFEADSGRVPVSGAGYRGPFAGEGFDGIWTDMSEIVRPTRDGIHGREWISTAVTLGRRAPIARPGPSPFFNVEIGVPVILNASDVPLSSLGPNLIDWFLKASKETQTLTILPENSPSKNPASSAAVYSSARAQLPPDIKTAKISELDLTKELPEKWIPLWKDRKNQHPDALVISKLPLDSRLIDPYRDLALAGVETIHLRASWRQRGACGRHLTEILRITDDHLVNAGVRDEVTLIVSGGITAAEHLPKSLLCGADAVAIDLAALMALGLSRFDTSRNELNLKSPFLPPEGPIAVQRLKNLLASWRDQLLEILGAMGIRDVQRTAGEIGRIMLYEDLEKEFQNLFTPANPNDDPQYG